VVFLGCGGGGGGGGGGPPAAFLFYTNESDKLGLWAVDPTAVSPAKIEIEDASTSVMSPTLVEAGSWGGTSGRITDVYTRRLVYGKDAGGGSANLYQLDARAASTGLTPVQLSSFADTLCSMVAEPDYANPENSLVFTTSPGADGNCGTTSDNVVHMISLSSGASDAPIEFAAGATLVGVVRSTSSGAIEDLLVLYAGDLWAGMPPGAAEDLGAVGSASLVAEWAGRTWLNVDNALKYFDLATSELDDPVGGPITFSTTPVFALDATHLFFSETSAGATINGILLDSSAESYTVHDLDGAQSIDLLQSAKNSLVYRDHTTGIWYGVPKSGGAPAELLVPQAAADSFSVHVSGPMVYITDAGTNVNATSIKEDGTGRVDYPGSATESFAWCAMGDSTIHMSTSRLDNPRYVVLVDAGDSDVALTSYDGPTGTQIAALGNITGVDSQIAYGIANASGDATLFAAGLGESKIWSVKATTANSAVLIDTSPSGKFLAPVGSSGCTTGGTGSLAAIGLTLLALLRRRRPAR